MFEGHNKITLCKAAVMKMMEDHLNKHYFASDQYIAVTDVTYDVSKWSATFSIEPKKEKAQ